MTIRNATLLCFQRYLSEEFYYSSDIKQLIEQAISNIDSYPIDKLSRWLGYVQAYFIFSNQTTVTIERDFSRPLFHEAYKTENIFIPISFETN